MKYLFVDTNNFIACALLTEPGQSSDTIKKLGDLLKSNKTKLILPELVEIEFFRVVETQLNFIEIKVKKFIKLINDNFPSYLKTDKNEYMGSMEKIFSKRKRNSTNVKKRVTALFEGDNVIKIPLTHLILLNAYKRALAGKRPYKIGKCKECGELKDIIDSDCVIFESILTKLQEMGQIELLFCSANYKDFAKSERGKNKQILHPDLESSFPDGVSCKYYLYLSEVLSSEFDTKIKEVESEKIKTYLDTTSMAPDLQTRWIEAVSGLHTATAQLADRFAGLGQMATSLKIPTLADQLESIMPSTTLSERLALLAQSPSIKDYLTSSLRWTDPLAIKDSSIASSFASVPIKSELSTKEKKSEPKTKKETSSKKEQKKE